MQIKKTGQEKVNLERLHRARQLHERGLLNDEDYLIFKEKCKQEFCLKCGGDIGKDYNFCIYCGVKLK